MLTGHIQTHLWISFVQQPYEESRTGLGIPILQNLSKIHRH